MQGYHTTRFRSALTNCLLYLRPHQPCLMSTAGEGGEREKGMVKRNEGGGGGREKGRRGKGEGEGERRKEREKRSREEGERQKGKGERRKGEGKERKEGRCKIVLTVRLSLGSCMMRVESLYESSFRLSSSAMVSSNAFFASSQALSGSFFIS